MDTSTTPPTLIRTEAGSRTTEQVFEDHLSRALRGDTAGDIATNFAPDVVLLTGLGVFRGHAGVAESRRHLGLDLPDARFTYVTKIVHGDYAFLEWTGESGHTTVDDGADGLVIVDGLIRMQTIHYTVRHRMGVRSPLRHVPNVMPSDGIEMPMRSVSDRNGGAPAQGTRLAVHLVPWDDRAFVRAFEDARAVALSEGLTINGPKAAGRVESLLRHAGFPGASVVCERTPDQALVHGAEWTVSRDGAPG